MNELGKNSGNSSPLSPIGFLERAATIYSDCTSIIYKDTTYTWSETYRRCLRLASSLSSLGITRGDVVSVVAPNVPAMYELHFAVSMAGAVLNTINIRLDARTVSVLLRHSESKLVFVDYQSHDLIQKAISLFDPKQKSPLLISIEEEQGVKISESENSLTYEDMIRKGNPEFKWVRPNSEWDPMILNYTSGTTSEPKGVVHCHRAIFIVSIDSLINWSVPAQPVYLWTLPMFHANGWSFPWGMAVVGATNICLRRFDAATIYSLIAKHRVTHLCGAPVVLNMMANAPDSDRVPLPHKIEILTAGAPPPAVVLHRIEALGFSVSHGYGLTETAGLVVCCSWKHAWNKLPASDRARLKARQGVRTIGTTAIDVIDSVTHKSVPHDGVSLGEIVLSGGSITLGYLKDPETTAKSITNGWFYTGDVGVMHPDGYLEIKDRSKDVIISGGENMSSVEIESVLYMHPSVNEAAVVARPDEFWGETPCAFVSLKKENSGIEKKTMEEEILEFCRKRLPHYMVPKTLVFEEELPKTSTGKTQKYLLREKAATLGAAKPVSRM